MTALAVATALLVVVAIAATYFVARASKAIVAIREDTVSLRKQVKAVLTQAQRTERTAARVADKLYHQNQHIDEMLRDPAIQRALRKEGRR